MPRKPLQAKYSGPFEIERKIDDTNYVVRTPDHKKDSQICHINMLKEYYKRDKTVLLATDTNQDHSSEDIKDIPDNSEAKLQNSNVLQQLDSKLDHLLPDQKQEIAEIIQQYKDLFPDVPNKTHIACHDVDVGDAAPIKQHPYRLSPHKVEHLQKEIQYMLDNEIVEPSNSSWSSPCILVPKPNGTFRFCTDYRKVNAVPKTDPFSNTSNRRLY